MRKGIVLLACAGVLACADEEERSAESSDPPAAGVAAPADPGESAPPVLSDPGRRVFPAPDAVSAFVRRIFQDSRGDLWFGTNGDGVARFDGASLTYHSTAEGLGGTAVRGIVEDRAGDVWFATSGGVTRYDGRSFVCHTVADGLGHDDVWSLLVTRDGTLWVGTYDGACRFDPKTGRFTPFPLPPAPRLDPLRGVTNRTLVRAILEDRAGDLWFAVGAGGVLRWDGESVTRLTAADGLADDSVNGMLETRGGELWFATHHGGVCRFDGASFTRVTEEDGVLGTEAWSLYEDRAGGVWFPTEGFGVYRYDGESYENFFEGRGLDSRGVQCVFEDREGRLWVGGYLGLYRLDDGTFVKVSRNGPW